MNKIDLRYEVASMFGENHPATVAVSKAVINGLRQEWLPVRPRPAPKVQCHKLLTQEYQAELRSIYNKDGRIAAIREIRAVTGFGLKDAIDCEKWIFSFGNEPTCVQKLPGYCPF